MSVQSSLSTKLCKLVGYQEKGYVPRKSYENPHSENGVISKTGQGAIEQFSKFRELLNNHLKGERGTSSIGCCSGKPQHVKMGLTAATPMSLRCEIIAQHNFRANAWMRENEGGKNATDDPIRISNLMAAVIGAPLSFSWRLIRASLRTAFLVLSLPYSLGQGYRYGIEGMVKKNLKRLSWEWIDCLVSFISIQIGLVNTFYPNTFNLDKLRDYYIKRIEDATKENQQIATRKAAYWEERMERARIERSIVQQSVN